MANTKLLS
jgi:ankyrin repeat protein